MPSQTGSQSPAIRCTKKKKKISLFNYCFALPNTYCAVYFIHFPSSLHLCSPALHGAGEEMFSPGSTCSDNEMCPGRGGKRHKVHFESYPPAPKGNLEENDAVDELKLEMRISPTPLWKSFSSLPMQRKPKVSSTQLSVKQTTFFLL